MDWLAKKDLVAPVEVERVEGPDRTVYQITAEGQAELTRWLEAVEEPSPFLSNPFSAKATIALLNADEATAADYLRRQRNTHMDRMRELTRIRTNNTARLTDLLAVDHAIAHLDADIGWLEIALERITQLKEDLHQ